jgi:uncharacterized membrane protein YfcA
MQHIVPTSLAVIALVSAAGVASSAALGGFNWSIALPFAAGAVTAMMAAGRLAAHFTGQGLQKGFAILAVAVAVSMVVKGVMALAS